MVAWPWDAPWMPWILSGAFLSASVLAAGHALLHKRSSRAALNWIFVCLAIPGFGALLYVLLGVNRIRTRARKLYTRDGSAGARGLREPPKLPAAIRENVLPGELTALIRIGDRVTGRALLGGNRVRPLHEGEEAYPAMLGAIESARRSVLLSTYIFQSDATGMRFVSALAGARSRGLDVRVLIDGVGEWYSLARIRRRLLREGVRVARFLPPSLLRGPGIHINLRNHRKILVTDGSRAFLGGMNLSQDHLAADPRQSHRISDVHFEVAGPVVHQIRGVFLQDWTFAAGAEDAPPFDDPAEHAGSTLARVVPDGPNEDFERIRWIVLGALAAARQHVRIMTPYFVPSPGLVAALSAASIRGVRVEILLPAANNLRFVHWASRAMLWQVLEHGVRVFLQPPPFVHSKIFLVDAIYGMIGSANLDPRSLRLNFECNLEVYDPALMQDLAAHADRCRDRSREVTLEEVDRRPLAGKLRDAAARLFAPYL